MNKYLFLIFLTLLFSCSGKSEKEIAEEKTDLQNSQSTGNTLSENQVKEGWKVLFNGTDLTGWRSFKNKAQNSWEVVNGMLHCKPFDSAGNRADIITIEKYKNFELTLDWKIAYQGNSGVMYRVTEDENEPYLTGPEYQILDDKNFPGKRKKEQYTGSVYDMYAPSDSTLVKSINDWNTTRIVVSGNKVEHWLNGKQVVTYEFNSEDWNKRKKASKWNDAINYGKAEEGHIVLQDHGSEVWFKNIFLKPL